jgi:uncharacterized delta-60 repeat protein
MKKHFRFCWTLCLAVLGLSPAAALRGWCQAGQVDETFQWGAGAVGWVTSLALRPDGKILAAGHGVNADNRSGLVRLNPDGTADATFLPALLPFDEDFSRGGILRSLAVQADGRILIGGLFRTVGMEDSDSGLVVARLNSDGSVDSRFRGSANFLVEAIAIQPDHRILIGGAYGIQRLTRDGAPDQRFDVGSGVDGPVNAIAVLPRRQILIGGGFSSVDGVERSALARLHHDGLVDPRFNVAVESRRSFPNGGARVLCLLVTNEKIFAGGAFEGVNGAARNGIVLLNANGSLDTTFDPEIGANVAIHGIAVRSDGKVLVVGEQFEPTFGATSGFAARLHRDGSLDATFALGDEIPWVAINSVILQANEQPLLGGVFYSPRLDQYGGVVRLKDN